jgi:hypothetical protein
LTVFSKAFPETNRVLGKALYKEKSKPFKNCNGRYSLYTLIEGEYHPPRKLSSLLAILCLETDIRSTKKGQIVLADTMSPEPLSGNLTAFYRIYPFLAANLNFLGTKQRIGEGSGLVYILSNYYLE